MDQRWVLGNVNEKVSRRFNSGDNNVCHAALRKNDRDTIVSGDIDTLLIHQDVNLRHFVDEENAILRPRVNRERASESS